MTPLTMTGLAAGSFLFRDAASIIFTPGNSGGGMTLSGGEPLAQYDFSLKLLKKAKENGIHTAVETCGYAEKSKILEIAKYVDLFLFDCKETDPDLHKEYTGVDNKIILENLKAYPSS